MLRRISQIAVLAGAFQAAAVDFTYTDRSAPLTSVRPDYTLSSLLPADEIHRVIGIDWLPGGDMAVLTLQDTLMPYEGGGRGWVHILSGARDAPAARPTLRTVYHGFEQPFGLAVAGADIHVSQRESLVKLVDREGDGSFDTLATVAAYPDSAFDWWGKWAMSLRHRDGVFYTGLGAYHFTGKAGPCLPSPVRGTVHAVDTQGRVELLGKGLREPNGIGFGTEGEIFVTDNDGEWVAANRLVHVRKDEFYGLVPCGSRDASLVETPPAVWFPEYLRSPGQPVMMPTGVFQGQLIVGDYVVMNLSRIFLEKVDGRYQGALFPFTGGLASAGLRLLSDGDGALYVGELTIDSYQAWWVEGPPRPGPGGVEKLAPLASTAFEMLAIRALPDGLELEFTRPAAPGASDPAGYRVKQWRLESTRNYGSPRYDQELLPVSEARLSEDGRKAILEVAGLKPNRVVHVQLHDGFRAADGSAPWAYEAWYTLNAIPSGPGAVTPPGTLQPAPRIALRRAAGARSLSVEIGGEGDIRLLDLGGRPVFQARISGRGRVLLPAELPLGLYILRVRHGGREFSKGLPIF